MTDLHPAIKILENYKKLVWPEIKKNLIDPDYPEEFKTPKKYQNEVDYLWKINRDYSERGGKYLRATLLILCCEAMGGNTRDAIKTAAAMQISQDWILISDDIEDDSIERRGKPTLHRIYGKELAINASDALETVMWKVVIDNLLSLSLEKTKAILEEFYKGMMRTTLGQGIEINWVRKQKIEIADEDWYLIGDSKSGYYTIALPVRLGAIIAGVSDEELKKLTKFSLNMGRCFQLIDDLLDITSDFSGLKKQTGNDIYEGKRTIMLGHLLRNTTPLVKNKILSILSKTREEKTETEVKWIIEKMYEYKSIEYAKNLAKKYKDEAKKIFKDDLKFLSKEPARTKFSVLIDFILERKY
jgi:geranylgeranyl diphosphate synthase, type II